MYFSRIWGEETPGRIAPKFCLVIGTRDIITCIKFGDDQLRGFRFLVGWWGAKVRLHP